MTGVADFTSMFCAAMSQVVVHQHDREHRLPDRHRPQSHAWIMPPGGGDLHGQAFQVDGAAGDLDARGGFEGHMRDDVLTGGYSAQYAAGIVAQETLRREFIAVLAALLAGRACSGTDFHRLHRVDAHHRAGDIGIQALEHRLP